MTMFTCDVHVLVCGRRTPPRGGAVKDGHGVDACVPCDRDDGVVAGFGHFNKAFLKFDDSFQDSTLLNFYNVAQCIHTR